MGFTRKQVDQLLRPIYPQRVLRDGKGHSHVSQQDVLAHLIRVFGFGNFDIEVKETECLFEQQHANRDGEVVPGKWDCCYRALVRLVVRDPDGGEVAHYENGSTATAQNQTRGDAHDLAYKSAISLSVKRAAIALGDNFGLSLYNKGQMAALVMSTIVVPDGAEHDGDLQDGVPEQVALGNDETEPEEQVRPRKVSEQDAARAKEKGIPVEQERAERLAEQHVVRDVLGVDSKGRVKDERQKAARSKPQAPDPDDPWATGAGGA